MGRIMAFDFGIKRTGIAVTDNLGMIANPIDTFPTDQVSAFLKSYLAQEKVEQFVVGQPRRLSGEDTHATEGVKGFVTMLQSKYPDIPLHLVDERFTSRMAGQVILQSGIGKEKRKDKKLVDKVSAVIILQSWLEQQTFTRNREQQ